MADGNFIAYYRVSTDKQGKSGLGLEAQKAAVANYLNGGSWELVAEYTEIESGKKSDRPELAAAVAACKRQKATLVIAKLDRLARNVHFISGLMESGVRFVAVDMPSADPFMLHVYAAMAEEEARRISKRTKDALAAAKARGKRLGKHGAVLAKRHKAEADKFAAGMAPIVRRLRDQGLSVRAITEQLNADQVPTMNGGRWHIPTVHRLLKRLDNGKVRAVA